MPTPGSHGQPTETIVARLDALLKALCDQVMASRVTLRLDAPGRGFHVDDVVAEALTAGTRSLRRQTSIDQRAAETIQWLDRERRVLVQNDLRGVKPAPPPELVELYGTTAQMLGPLVRDDALVSWISVHYDKGPRRWSVTDIAALEAAIAAVYQALDALDLV
jgi:maleate isomerase